MVSEVRRLMLMLSFTTPRSLRSDFIGLSLIIAIFLLLSACSEPRVTKASIRASDPAVRLAAIRLIEVNPTPSDIPDLIGALDSDDPAVRLMAIGTLHKITGQSFDYRFDASPAERNQAVSAWAQAWKNNTLSYFQHGAPQP